MLFINTMVTYVCDDLTLALIPGPALRPPRSDARASARVDEMASFAASYVFPAVEHGVVKPRLKMQQVDRPLMPCTFALRVIG